MILISKFHDYYDFCCHLYRDNKVVFNREIEQINPTKEIKSLDLHAARISPSFNKMRELNQGVVIFCGKPFRFIREKFYTDYSRMRSNPAEYVYEYNRPEEFNQLNSEIKNYYENTRRFYFRNKVFVNDNVYQKILEDYKCYYVSIVKNSYYPMVMKHPILKDIHFPMDPHQVFQTLMGNMQAQDPDIVEVSDKIKLTQHGFNDTSFKTRKGTKPNRKRK